MHELSIARSVTQPSANSGTYLELLAIDALPTRAVPLREVSALTHEIRDDPVEKAPLQGRKKEGKEEGREGRKVWGVSEQRRG